MYGGTHSNYQRLGIQEQCMRRGIDIAKQNNFKYLFGEMQNEKTQILALEKLGWKETSRVYFDEFRYKGANPFDNITKVYKWKFRPAYMATVKSLLI